MATYECKRIEKKEDGQLISDKLELSKLVDGFYVDNIEIDISNIREVINLLKEKIS